ncbi:uncharacterized protein LOC124463873 [Hypomesus transpacificus]|uniref:uncharacterized protein LOC124463873 n=1 Tax=Hypomesus transpacificus TaxID=137520 RepID=UPI001F076E69|nr:uncharacterized protein LOC124463873 [Hypomesus transpacificus]
MSNAEQMTQHGLEQSQLWHSVANQSSELRMGPPPGHPPHLQQQPTDLGRDLVSHTWTLLETPGVAGERSQLPNCTPPTPSAGQSVHYRDSFCLGREGQSDSFPASCQLQLPLPVAKSSPSWFSRLLQVGVETKDHLPRDTNKPIAWDTCLQRWVNRRASNTEAGSFSPTNAPCPPTTGNDAIQNGINKYSVQAVPGHLRNAYPSWKNCWRRTLPLTSPPLPSAPLDHLGYLLSQIPSEELVFPSPSEGWLKVELLSEGLSFSP